jgi:hypothetical protein
MYRGPYWPFVRGYLGDWLVVQIIYLIGRFFIGDRWRYYWAGGVLLVGVLVEVIQFLGAALIPHTFAAEITTGRTFDPLDVAAYLLGIAAVLVVDQVLIQSQYSIAVHLITD